MFELILLQDVGTICKDLPALSTLNLSYNLMAKDIVGLPQLKNIRILVLNNTGLKWKEVSIYFSISFTLPLVFTSIWFVL